MIPEVVERYWRSEFERMAEHAVRSGLVREQTVDDVEYDPETETLRVKQTILAVQPLDHIILDLTP